MRIHLLAFPILPLALVVNILMNPFTHGASSHAAASNSTNNLSLAQAFPVEKLREILIPREQWRPFPSVLCAHR